MLGKSRHNVITFQYQLECLELNKVGYNYHKVDYTAMKRKHNNIEWQELFQGKNFNLSWETFLKLLNEIILKYSPRFTFSNKCKKCIWMNSQAFSKVQLKNRAYHQYLRTKDHNDYNIYIKYRNQAKRRCRKPVSDYEHSLSKEVKSNPKAFFTYAKSNQILKIGAKLSHQTKAKLPYFTFFIKVYSRKKKIHC